MQEPWVASRSTPPAPLGRQTMVARKTQVGSSRPTPFLPPVVGSAEGGGVTGGRQGLHRQLRPSLRLLLKLSLGTMSCPARRAVFSLTR